MSQPMVYVSSPSWIFVNKGLPPPPFTDPFPGLGMPGIKLIIFPVSNEKVEWRGENRSDILTRDKATFSKGVLKAALSVLTISIYVKT